MVKFDGAAAVPTLFVTFKGYVPAGKLFDAFGTANVILSMPHSVTLHFFCRAAHGILKIHRAFLRAEEIPGYGDQVPGNPLIGVKVIYLRGLHGKGIRQGNGGLLGWPDHVT